MSDSSDFYVMKLEEEMDTPSADDKNNASVNDNVLCIL